ncbi:hypothetical protein ACJX0J_020838 [Zea mays]
MYKCKFIIFGKFNELNKNTTFKLHTFFMLISCMHLIVQPLDFDGKQQKQFVYLCVSLLGVEKHFHLLTGDNYLCYNRKEKQVVKAQKKDNKKRGTKRTKTWTEKVRKTKNKHYTSKIADMFKQQGRREENNWTIAICENPQVQSLQRHIRNFDQITIIRSSNNVVPGRIIFAGIHTQKNRQAK